MIGDFNVPSLTENVVCLLVIGIINQNRKETRFMLPPAFSALSIQQDWWQEFA
jgi:hypothetical protein